MKQHLPRSSQRGAALAVALLMLVIITLLGVAAVRATQVELKLSNNAESRMAAVQTADSMVAYVIANNLAALPVDGNGAFSTCVLPSTVRSGLPLFQCAISDLDVSGATLPLRTWGYAQARRQLPLFVEVGVLREAELSAKNYNFARFNITGGYDRGSDAKSAAEVTESALKLHTKVAGVNYED